MEHPLKILVVDDELQIQSLLESFLTHLGYNVRIAGDGEQAIQLLQKESFAGVLTDLKMAKMGGMELLRSIKQLYPGLPVVMITGYPSVEIAVEAMKEGAADFITKPLRLDELSLVLTKITNNRASEQHVVGSPPIVTASSPSPLHGKIKELSILYTISEAFQTVTDIDTIFERLVQVSREIVGTHYSSFTILDFTHNRAALKTIRGCDQDYLFQIRNALNDETLDNLIKYRKPLIFNDEHAGIAVPVLIKNKLLGILSVWDKLEGLPFTEEEVLLLVTLCRKAALSVENQFLFESLYQSLLETLKALVTTLEARDPYTGAHSQRVSQYATALAARMGCSKEEQDIVMAAGFLHDIGKVGICDAILLKTDPLTPAEYEVIKTHPIIGEQIVQHLGFFTRERAIIRHHHEWWDGRGYPDALIGHQIPFLARIVTVADAFDAITTNRPYRGSRSFQEGLDELRCWAGIQFDAEAIVAFQHVVEKDLTVAPPAR
jgi:response regulator RpfG family c-di-GMP phosphodiesterase